MDVLPTFLNGATKSFMSVGHDGEMEDDHWSSMKEFWEQEKAAWGQHIENNDEKDSEEEKKKEAEFEEKRKEREAELAAEAKAAAEKEEMKKLEQKKLEEMEQADAEQVVQARMLHEEEAETDVVQKHHSWLGSMFAPGGRHGPPGHGKGKHGMQCNRMKMCMRMAMGWAMKWAVKKTYEMCQKCDSKKVQMMCKWAGAHKKFAFGMLVAHVAPWKFALGRCLHRHRGRGAEWPGHHGHHGHHDHH